MTMANATSSTPHRPSPSASLRKTNKPLMEKRRRARINDSLTQLKSLVIHSSKKDSSQFNKLEKADILELTVKHLRNLQNQQQQQQQMSQGLGPDNSTGKYRAGFMECANEVIRYLKQSQGFSDDVKTRVVGHLAGCLQLSTQQTYSRPTAAATIVTQNAAPPRLTTTTVPPPAAAATAQLANGQIIQIVNAAAFQPSQAPVQQAPPAAAPTAVLVATSSVPAAAVAPSQQLSMSAPDVSSSLLSSSPSSSSSLPSSRCPPSDLARATQEQHPASSSYTRYCQPLHIQIPPTLSPVLLKTSQQQRLQQQPQQQPQQQQPLALKRSEDHIPPAHQSRPVSPPPRHNCSNSSSPSSPVPKDFSPPSKPAYKQLDFYANDLHSEYPPRSRTFSMTSSSSSSESEMMSPLNLSQSPPFSSYDNSKEISRPVPKMSQFPDSHHSTLSYIKQQDKVSPVPVSGLMRDNVDYSQHPNFTSVIVNAKKSVDIPSAKYMRMMMEDDRHCVRPQGTPSPASSMGEERLWRPW